MSHFFEQLGFKKKKMAVRPLTKGHNNNRHLSPEEMDCNINGLPVTDSKLRELFDSYDINHHGYLDFSEVKKIYAGFDNFGLAYTDKELDAQIRKHSNNPDDIVSFDEFACLILSIAQR